MKPAESKAVRMALKELTLAFGSHLRLSGRDDIGASYDANNGFAKKAWEAAREKDGKERADEVAIVELALRLVNSTIKTLQQSTAGTSTDGLQAVLDEYACLTTMSKKALAKSDKPVHGPVELKIDETSATPPWEDAEDARLAGRK